MKFFILTSFVALTLFASKAKAQSLPSCFPCNSKQDIQAQMVQDLYSSGTIGLLNYTVDLLAIAFGRVPLDIYTEWVEYSGWVSFQSYICQDGDPSACAWLDEQGLSHNGFAGE